MSEMRYWKSLAKRASYAAKANRNSSSDESRSSRNTSNYSQLSLIPFRDIEIKQTFYFGNPSQKFWKISSTEAAYVVFSKEISFMEFPANKQVKATRKKYSSKTTTPFDEINSEPSDELESLINVQSHQNKKDEHPLSLLDWEAAFKECEENASKSEDSSDGSCVDAELERLKAELDDL